MGLAIGLAAPHDAEDPEYVEHLHEQLNVLNTYLESSGLPSYAIPENPPEFASRAACLSLPYSFLHYLRRVYAYLVEDESWKFTPVPEGVDPAHDEVVEEETYMFSSHLICHSDCEGYYLPIDFSDLLTGDDILGGFAGSSFRLLEEVVRCAAPLGIELDGSDLSDAEAERVNSIAAADEGAFREYSVWILLYETARGSIATNLPIEFG